MTSFAFICGCLPLLFAKGAGAASRQILGTAVVFGMLLATMVAILFVPMLYVSIERLFARRPRTVPAAHPTETGASAS
jgi:multidrug efflux pump subunit AcrB